MGTFTTSQIYYDEYMRIMYQGQRAMQSTGLGLTDMAGMANMAAPKEKTPNKVLLLCK